MEQTSHPDLHQVRMTSGAAPASAPTIKRIAKACGPCRHSKLRCDGEEPCSRCRRLGKECLFPTPSKPSNEDKLDQLQQDVLELKELVTRNLPAHALHSNPDAVATFPPLTAPKPTQVHSISPHLQSQSITSPSVLGLGRKRTRSGVRIDQSSPTDFVSRGLISIEAARSAFEAFFAGCDRFVPVFDPAYDTFDSLRRRSSFLFDAICTTGCTVSDETLLSRMLNSELKKLLNQVVILWSSQSLETVQALLVIACYSPERSLLLSLAARLAIDVDLPSAFDELIASLAGDGGSSPNLPHLMRCSRTWFELLVLENMLQVDAGKLPAFNTDSHVRRCRVLLQQHSTTPLDLRLLSQVELNHLRTTMHAEFGKQDGGSEEDIVTTISNARIDIDLWYNDWKSLMESSPVAGMERPLLLINLRVQKHWCEAMAYFRALKCLQCDNIDAMSSAGRRILAMAKAALKAHLSTTLEEPNHYLPNLRFAMDFVWAKCAFCFLLVLKLTRLLPESQEDNYRLLEEGNQLYQHMMSAGNCAGSTTSRLYVQVLGMSLDKYGRALSQHYGDSSSTGPSPPTFFWESSDASLELQSFVPEEFVFEWNFPGLTLFSSPASWQDFFDEYLLGTTQQNNVASQV